MVEGSVDRGLQKAVTVLSEAGGSRGDVVGVVRGEVEIMSTSFSLEHGVTHVVERLAPSQVKAMAFDSLVERGKI